MKMLKVLQGLLLVSGYAVLITCGVHWYITETTFESCAKDGRAQLSERLEIDCLPVEDKEK